MIMEPIAQEMMDMEEMDAMAIGHIEKMTSRLPPRQRST